ncbi:MAG: DNA polymerase Y family protein [Xanthomonadales bacterium]|jgi:protein ImuB|nr:DNA polymerase Y family protein [Xanthomonadales bacterium]
MDWACLRLPQLALDAALRTVPDPERPWVLLGGPANRPVLLDVNPAAAALGLRPGMPLPVARARADGFGCLTDDAARGTALHTLLADWAHGYSNQVSRELPEAVVFEIAGSRSLFGDWPRLRLRLRADLDQLGVHYRLIAAPNPYAARVLAEVESDAGIPAEALGGALGQLPLEAALLDARTLDVLRRSGLRRLRQVLALPREALARRFPASLLRWLDQLCGRAPVTLALHTPAERWQAAIELPCEVTATGMLLFPLRRLIDGLVQRLRALDGAVQRWQLTLTHARGGPVPETVLALGLAEPSRDAALLFELARERLAQLVLPAPVLALAGHADTLPRYRPPATDLFEARPPGSLPWPALCERLRGRLGEQAVQGLQAAADHRPEHASRCVAVHGEPAARKPRPDAAALAVPRPAWLLATPVPLPSPVVEVLAGPERIEAGWWDLESPALAVASGSDWAEGNSGKPSGAADVRRDYYIVLTREGRRAWVYCAAGHDGPYWLHGWFD